MTRIPDTFSTACRACPRLAAFLDDVRARHPDYHARPVASFGDPAAPLLVVGLAPGMHGANRTGRPFTGDHAGILLYETLHRFGLATRPVSVAAGDGLELVGCRIANAVRCLPPQNKPLPAEVRECNGFLAAELAGLPEHAAVVALGRVAHDAVLLALGLRARDFAFAHGARHGLDAGRALFDSYHCSRYNTQTKRLDRRGFEAVFAAAARHLGAPPED